MIFIVFANPFLPTKKAEYSSPDFLYLAFIENNRTTVSIFLWIKVIHHLISHLKIILSANVEVMFVCVCVLGRDICAMRRDQIKEHIQFKPSSIFTYSNFNVCEKKELSFH